MERGSGIFLQASSAYKIDVCIYQNTHIEMVFHMYITCTLEICEETGKHFYYGGFQKLYGIPSTIPEEHRKYVNITGDIFNIYAMFVTDETSTSLENFVDKFPEWSDIIDTCDFEKDFGFWTEEMHNKFYESLKWIAQQNVSYTISWTL
jgi:hypothetical protein